MPPRKRNPYRFCPLKDASADASTTTIYTYISGNLYVYLVIDLGRLYIVLSDAVERRLRLAVVVRLGGKKGNLSGAIEAAVVDWLNKKPRNQLSHNLAVE
jgi:hypothetical protein